MSTRALLRATSVVSFLTVAFGGCGGGEVERGPSSDPWRAEGYTGPVRVAASVTTRVTSCGRRVTTDWRCRGSRKN
jgi:hypothetical protein